MLVTAAIPTLNEESTIGSVVERSLEYVDKVLVVDGGSVDRTRTISADSGAQVLCLRKLGLGYAIREAIMRDNSDIMVILDGDGSHIPEDIPLLVEPIQTNRADLTIACRLTGGSEELFEPSHLMRRLGSATIQFLVNYRMGIRLTDIQNGFRAIRLPVAKALGLQSDNFCICQEMAIRCIQQGYRVVNIPSKELSRKYGRSKLCLRKEAPAFLRNVAQLLFFERTDISALSKNCDSKESCE
jgi:glycosyltransferase involved in cell wall biosynthesis